MTRMDLIDKLARHAGLTPDGARRAVEVLFGTREATGVIAAALRAGERVQLAGFGTFESRHRKERRGLNPQTREPLLVPGGATPVFRPAAAFRDLVRDTAVV